MDWDSIDWAAIEKLRDVFIARSPGVDAPIPYWTAASQIASYDFTLGRRIAWKWAAVLSPLIARDWQPPAQRLVDWGCGSGIAARSMLAYCAPGAFKEVVLWDHSPIATTFAADAIRSRHPDLAIRVADPAGTGDEGEFVLVVSHVLNELNPSGCESLLALAKQASAVIWVEPGTSADSRALIAVRETLRETFHCLAPCPHDGPCGLLTSANERHWCHHFATAPTAAFTEKGWGEFGRRLGIDLRSLPYSYLVLDRRPSAQRDGCVRVIGEPRVSTGVMRILRCRADGVAEIELQKRTAAALWRTLEKGRHTGSFHWVEDEGRILSGEPVP